MEDPVYYKTITDDWLLIDRANQSNYVKFPVQKCENSYQTEQRLLAYSRQVLNIEPRKIPN